MLRLVPDTSTLVAGTISLQGTAAEIIAAWRDGRIAVVTCEEIITEYQVVLNRSSIRRRYRHIRSGTIAASVATLREYGRLVTVTQVPQVVVRDPDDNVILACATAGDADYVVSRDRDLLDLVAYRGISIVSERTFLSILEHRVREEGAAYQPTAVQSMARL